MKFMGYRRVDGRVGTRNYVGILSTVVCANEVARGIAAQVKGAVAFSHQQGCCQTPPDLDRVANALIGLGGNPNLAAVLLVGLGCEGTDVQCVAQAIAVTGKSVEIIGIQEEGGGARTTAKGVLIAQQMAVEASRISRIECPASELVLGLKCGSSDTTSGLAANTRRRCSAARWTGRAFESYVAVAIIYYVMYTILSAIFNRIERRSSRFGI
jgi:altronate dehydratase large subunit